MVFIITFASTSWLVNIAGNPRIRSWWTRIALCLIAALTMAVFAGARDFDPAISTDVLIYGNRIFAKATESSSFGSLKEVVGGVQNAGDVGYLWINFIVSRFTHDPHVFYFALSLISSSIVLIAIMLVRDFGSSGLMWFTYLSWWYVSSFNLLRQSVAMPLVLLGVVLTARGFKKLGLIVGALSMLFHITGFIFLGMWLVACYLIRAKSDPVISVVRMIALAGMAVASVGVILPAVNAALYGSFTAVDYLAGGSWEGRPLAIVDVYRIVPLVAGAFLVSAQRAVRKPMSDRRAERHVSPPTACEQSRDVLLRVIFVLLATEAVLLPVRGLMEPMLRVLFYFGFANIIGYSVMARAFSSRRLLASCLVIVLNLLAMVRMGRLFTDRAYSSEILEGWLGNSAFGGSVTVAVLAALIVLCVGVVAASLARRQDPAGRRVRTRPPGPGRGHVDLTALRSV